MMNSPAAGSPSISRKRVVARMTCWPCYAMQTQCCACACLSDRLSVNFSCFLTSLSGRPMAAAICSGWRPCTASKSHSCISTWRSDDEFLRSLTLLKAAWAAALGEVNETGDDCASGPDGSG